MNTRRIKPISCVLVFGTLAVIWAITSASPSVSMRVGGFTVKRSSDDIAPRMGGRDYVVATIELSNASSRVVTYWAWGHPDCPDYTRLFLTPTGWKEPARGLRCGTGIKACTLAPSQTITFDAVVDRDKPCKVALNYTDGRSPSSLWRRLPGWLTRRLPWARGWNTVTTDDIDLRGVSLAFKSSEPFFQPPQETPAVRAAAQSGDVDAQFR